MLEFLYLNFDGTGNFVYYEGVGDTVSCSKGQLHVTLVIIIHYKFSLVMFFDKSPESSGRIFDLVFGIMCEQHRCLKKLVKL